MAHIFNGYKGRRTALRVAILGAVFGACGAVPAWAAGVPAAQTGAASAGRVQEQVAPRDLMPRQMPRVEIQEAPTPEAPAGADKIAFRLDSLALEGVTAYSEADLQPVYADRLGTTITLTELYGIAADLTRKYRNDGYVLTQVIVPPQEIENGSAKLRVVEGYIDDITVQGDADNDQTLNLMRAYTAHIRTGEGAVNIRDLERALLLINDLPGVSARSIISPSPDKVGGADLRVIVTRDPFEGMVGIDNQGTRYLGPLELSGAVSLNSMLGMNERITAQYVTAPDKGWERELDYFALGYAMPVGTAGTQLSLTNSYSFTDPGYDLEDFHVKGRGVYYAATVSHPFLRTRNGNFTARATFDVRDVDSSNNIEDTRKDRIRAVRVGGRYEYLDRLFGFGFNVLDFEVAHGIDVLGSSHKGDFMSRIAADPNFTKANVELQRLQRLFPGVNLLLGAKGQWADDALYSSEEFGVGGMSYGRGFDPSEIIGDDGVAGKLEVQWNDPVKSDMVDTYQLYGFWDGGRIWNTDPGTNALRTDTVSSAGMGVRAQFPGGTDAGLLVAFPLNRDPETMGDRDARFYFNLSHRF
jgi:hemolysin activation/secretion protein